MNTFSAIHITKFPHLPSLLKIFQILCSKDKLKEKEVYKVI